METDARNYINLTELWEQADKSVVINNIERIFGDSKTLKRNKDGTRINTLSEITFIDKNTVRAWMNQSRTNVKIPLLKLCMIAEALNIDVKVLLSDRGDWRNESALNPWLVSVYESIRMNQYYKLDGWDVESFVKDIHEHEVYNDASVKSKVEKLVDDCLPYFEIVVGVKDEKINDSIVNAANAIHNS